MLARNGPTYAKWIAILHSPFVFVAFALGVWRGPHRLVVASAAGFVLGILLYLFKAPFFDDFGLIRYILPALIPCLLVAVIGVGDLLTRRLSRVAASAVLFVVIRHAAFRGDSLWGRLKRMLGPSATPISMTPHSTHRS